MTTTVPVPIRSLLLVASATLTTTMAAAQGADDCAAPQAIDGPGVYAFDTTSATESLLDGGGAVCQAEPFHQDVFFRYKSDFTGRVFLRTCGGTTLNTRVAVYDGIDCSAPCIFLDWNDCGLQSRIRFDAQNGAEYLIQIGAVSDGLTGSGTFEISNDPPPPANDSCATPLVLVGEGSVFYNRTHATQSGFDGGDPDVCAVGSVPAGLFQTGPIYRDCFIDWTATMDGAYTLRNCGSSFQSGLIVLHAGDTCSATCVTTSMGGGCADDESGTVLLLPDVLAGDRFLIQIGDRIGGSTLGAFANLEVTRVEAPANDTCATPEPIFGTGTFPFENASANTEGFIGAVNCGAPPPDRDRFYRWVAPSSGVYRLDLCNAFSFNSRIAVFAGYDCEAHCIANSNGGCSGSRAVVNFAAVADQVYLLQIGGGTGLNGVVDSAFVLGLQSGFVPIAGVEPVCRPAGSNSSGQRVTLETSALNGAASSGVHLECTGGPPGQFGFFLMSAGNQSWFPVGGGRLCLDVPFVRYDATLATAMGNPAMRSLGRFDPSGRLVNVVGTATAVPGGTGFDVPLELPGGFPGQTFLPGDVRTFQVWYRDTAGGGSNLSDGARVTFP